MAEDVTLLSCLSQNFERHNRAPGRNHSTQQVGCFAVAAIARPSDAGTTHVLHRDLARERLVDNLAVEPSRTTIGRWLNSSNHTLHGIRSMKTGDRLGPKDLARVVRVVRTRHGASSCSDFTLHTPALGAPTRSVLSRTCVGLGE